ncbi:hypothetical protein E6H19_09935 [Candidatus Bathyarchaeota archaeon]|nr:MAG: hypothetical protein E6H30_09150 [Candidatus Bathyarchaeota archaeon]TMI43359.1 MAG: hypothetical protein E6H19_09935 [Candidatus Bathyarchaeota archaeon]
MMAKGQKMRPGPTMNRNDWTREKKRFEPRRETSDRTIPSFQAHSFWRRNANHDKIHRSVKQAIMGLQSDTFNRKKARLKTIPEATDNDLGHCD